MEDENSESQSYEDKQKAIDKKVKTMEEDTRVWLETDEKVKAWLAGFKQSGADDFVKRYPSMKVSFIRYGSTLGERPEEQQVEYLDQAYKRLMDIQQKKIFDVMCQWDANLLQIDDMLCSWDFARWHDDPSSCPFITPIAREEVELYLSYVDSRDFDKEPYISLIDYDSYRDDKTEYDPIPEWFLFENLRTGNNKYLVLPMLRTPQEDVYRSLWRKEENEKLEKKYESGELTRYVPDTRPDISTSHYKDIEQFIILFEDKETLSLFRKHYAYFTDHLIREDPEAAEDGLLTERATDIIHNMTGVKEKLPVEANSDWRKALIVAYEKYEKGKIKEAIPYAYNNYLMKRELNIMNNDERDNKFYNDLAESVRNQILRGRELNGEPRDFNF